MQSAAASQYNCTQTITLGWMTKGNKHDVVVQALIYKLRYKIRSEMQVMWDGQNVKHTF